MKARYSIKRICLVWLLVFACALLVFTCADAAYAIHLNERTTGGFITSNRITAAAAGGEYVFIGTTEGLFLYPPAGGEKIHLTADDGLVSSHITSLYFSSGCGILAIGTNNGVSLFSSVDEPILSCTVSDGLASNDIRAVYIDDTEGRLYVSLFGGWVSTGRLEGLSKPSFETYQTGGGHATMVSSVGVSNYCRDPGGRLWHGTNGSGVHILHPSGEWESFADIMRGLWVTGLASPGGGHMYIGTTDGLFRCPVDNIQDITSVEPFSDLWIKGLGVRKGHLLAGSVEGLFSLLHDKRVDVNSVYCLNTRRLNTVESSAEIFMIGTEDDGVYVYDYPFPRIPLASGPNGESWLREEERSYDRKTVICCYSNEEDVAALVSLAETIGLALLQRDETLKALLFSAGKNMDVEQHMADLLRKVEDSGTVKGRVTVHKNRYMSPAYQSSDPLYTVQHSYLEQTGVEELWERWEHSQPEGEVTGRGVTVAVVDTGVSSQHIDLDGQVTAGENFNVPSNGSAEDDNSHGTFCAGIIACLFATHYHELTELAKILSRINNYNISVRKQGEDIVFLRRIVPGGVSHSFGIEVARLAGIPEKVIERAQEVLKDLESVNILPGFDGGMPGGIPVEQESSPPGKETGNEQLRLFEMEEHPAVTQLREMSILEMSPLEAINRLYELQCLVRGKEAGKTQPAAGTRRTRARFQEKDDDTTPRLFEP